MDWPKTKLSPRRYLMLALLAAAIAVGGPFSFLYWAKRHGRLVAPALTGNVCFDEKVRFLRDTPGKECDVLIIGSSMALSNLESQVLLTHLPANTRVLNAGSWNMKVGHIRAFLECLLPIYHPKTIILVSGMMDFYRDPRPSQFFDAQEVTEFINGSSYWLSILRHFDLQYYVRWSFSIARDRSTRQDYHSLMFDPWGDVSFDIFFPNIDEHRWNQKIDFGEVDPHQYQEFERLVNLIHQHELRLICLQTPLRQGSIPASENAAADEHWQRLDTILRNQGFNLWNLQKTLKLSDENFADYSHLNEKGAAVVSELLGRKVGSTELGNEMSVTQRSVTR